MSYDNSKTQKIAEQLIINLLSHGLNKEQLLPAIEAQLTTYYCNPDMSFNCDHLFRAKNILASYTFINNL